MTTNTCVICYSNTSNLIVTKCRHSYCSSCFFTWYFTKLNLTNLCCFCRQEITIEDYIEESFYELKEYYKLKQLIKNKSYSRVAKLELQTVIKGLIPACYYNDLDTVSIVLENIKIDIPDILLYFACISKKKEVLYYFIDFKSVYFDMRFIKKLLYLGHIELVEFIYNSTTTVIDINDVLSHFIKKREESILTDLLDTEFIRNSITIDEDLIELCVIHLSLELFQNFEKIHPSSIDMEKVIYTASANNKDDILTYMITKKDIRYSIYDSYLLAIESECYKSLECLLEHRKSDYEIFLANKLCYIYGNKNVKAFISQLKL